MFDAQEERERLAESTPPPDSPNADRPTVTAQQLVRFGLGTEAACVVAAVGLGMFGWYDASQPLGSLFHVDWPTCLMWAAVGTLVTSALAAIFLALPLQPFRDFRQFTMNQLVPIFAPLNVGQVALVSAGAGLGEELLFRWCLQGGLQTAWSGGLGFAVALVGASLLFGLCHAINRVYFAFATIMGAGMGGLMYLSGSVVPAILAHGLYDFGAILVLRRIGRRMTQQQNSGQPLPG